MRQKHLLGQGCKYCNRVAGGDARKLSTETLIERFKSRHGNSFDYSLTVCSGSNNKIIIGCSKHGFVETTPNAHLAGTGCPACGRVSRSDDRRVTTEDFIKRSESAHKVRYDYSLVDLGSVSSVTAKIPIICLTHGVFTQKAWDHMNGRGCNKCVESGYRTNKPGSLYLMQSDGIIKVGITNSSPSIRAKHVSKSSRRLFEIKFYIRFENGEAPPYLETIMLQKLRSLYSQPVEKFDGSTECFLSDDLSGVQQHLLETILEYFKTTRPCGLHQPEGNLLKELKWQH